jgi:hypothetical protein
MENKIEKIDPDSQPFALPEGIDPEEYIVATYYAYFPSQHLICIN